MTPRPAESRSDLPVDAAPAVPLNATLVHRQDIADDLAIFRVSPDEGRLIEFEPGQFATLGLPLDESAPANPPAVTPQRRDPHPQDDHEPAHVGGRLIRRAYSIASAPSTREYLEFYIARVPAGRFTTRLWPLETGDRLWLDPHIRGRFTLQPVPHDADLLMIATGTGVAPFMSMLRHDEDGARWRRAALLHGVRYVRDLGYHDELSQRARRDPAFAYIPSVTREPPDSPWPGRRGRVQSLLHDAAELERMTHIAMDPARTHIMLCGNPEMIRSVSTLFESRGFQAASHQAPGNVHMERYW